jgi:hypothetical protein
MIFVRAWSVKPSSRFVVFQGELAKKVICQDDDVSAADAKGRHLDMDDV